MKSQTASFLKTFNLKYPILQSPMAGASTVELASTITNLGGLGAIPLGSYGEKPDVIQKQFSQFQSLVKDKSLAQTVNLNFFTHEPPSKQVKSQENWIEYYKGIYSKAGIPWDETYTSLNTLYPSFKSINDVSHPTVQLLTKLKPQIVSLHFGLPSDEIIQYLQNSGIKIFITVTNLNEFKESVSSKVDGVVLQGWEAGGHRGNFIANDLNDDQLTTRELINTIVTYIDETNLQNPPFLIGAGGIYDSQSANALLEYGIAGVQLGTVWLPTNQATISPSHLELFKNPKQLKTIMTPAISGRNLRTIESDFLNQLSQVKTEDIPDYPLPYDIFKKLNSDSKDSQHSAFLAGGNFHRSYHNTNDPQEVFNNIASKLRF